MNSVVHFVSNPTVIELKVKILYVICFAFSFQLKIFHNTKVDILWVFIFGVFVIYTYRTESAQVWERGGHGIRKDLELGLFQGSPKAQPRYMHKAVGYNIWSEFEETFLLKILNAFHSMQHFSCVKNFLWLSTKLRQSYPLPPTWFLLQVSFSNCSTRSHCTNVQISCNETH